MYRYSKIQGPRSSNNYIIAGDKKRHGHGASFATHLRTMKVYNTQPVSFTIKVFLLVFIESRRIIKKERFDLMRIFSFFFFFFNAATLYCKHYKVLQNKTLNK